MNKKQLPKTVLLFITLLIYRISIAQTPPVCFDPLNNNSFPVVNGGSQSTAIINADFNNDGNIDLAVANYNSNNVSIFLGIGDATFSSSIAYLVGSGPVSLTTGDFNNDGKLDIATANSNFNTISIILGNGTGSFSAPVNYIVGLHPYSVSSSDYNSDGNLDLAVVNQSNNNISIMLGNGAGSFTLNANYPVGINPYTVISKDFNNDSKIDLAVTNGVSNSISILLGSGTGTFSAATSFSIGSSTSPIILEAADFNGDAKIDIVTSNYSTNNVSVLLGDGSGSFSSATSFSTGIQPTCVTISDINGDSNLDLITANKAQIPNNKVSVLLGDGLGSFSLPYSFTVSISPQSVTSADFNNDGKFDVAVAHYSASNLAILINGPALNINSVNTICLGNTATLSTNIAGTYSWNTGATSSIITVSPTVTTSYSVIATTTSGCSNMAIKTITVLNSPLPTITATSNNTLICSGETATLTASGADTYEWNTNQTSATIVVNPTITATYTVIGTDINGCNNNAIITQNVNTCTELNYIENNSTSIIGYPNPNNGCFTIQSNIDLQLELINSLGQTIKSIVIEKSNNYQFKIEGLTEGIYYLIKKGNYQNINQKIIITR